MNKSDFYVLPSQTADARLAFLYKLLEKIHGLGHLTYIRAESEQQAKLLDHRLWDYQDQAFLPHSLVSEGLRSPIEIGYADALPAHRDVYLNFALEIPDSALSFGRIIEIVTQEDAVLRATRANYRRYQKAGYQIQMNTIAARR